MKSKKKVLTLFIHGIGSDNSTWLQFEKVLKSDNKIHAEKYDNGVPKNDIFYYDKYEYKSFFFKKRFKKSKEKIFGENSNLSISDFSKNLITHIGTYNKFDKINIVAHSMGGLITLECLFNIYKDKNYKLEKKIQNIVLIASPLTGSDDADDLEKYFGKKLISDALSEMMTKSITITSLLQGIEVYKTDLLQHNILYINGTSDTRIVQNSIDKAKGFSKTENIQANHTQIKEPDNVNDTRYTLVKNHLLKSNNFNEKNETLKSISKLKEKWREEKSKDEDYQSHIILESTYVETLYGNGTYITYSKYKIEMMEDGEVDFNHKFRPFDKKVCKNIEDDPYYKGNIENRFNNKSYKIKIMPKEIGLHANQPKYFINNETSKEWVNFTFDSNIIAKGKIFYIIISISDKVDISTDKTDVGKKARKRRKEYFHTELIAEHANRKIKYQLETYCDCSSNKVKLPFEPILSIAKKKQLNNENCKEGLYYKTWEWNIPYSEVKTSNLEFNLYENDDFINSGAECKFKV